MSIPTRPARRKIIINSTHSEETRVAITEDRQLIDYDLEMLQKQGKGSQGSIYKAKVTSVQKSLNAVFVDYGSARHGFLPLKEIAADYSKRQDISEGQELLIQIEKEERGTKGAAVTTYIALAGCYAVLMPNNPDSGGVSRKIEGEERQQLKQILSGFPVPPGMSVIIRTAGVGKSSEELNWDISTLLSLWEAIQKTAATKSSPCLIYKDADIVFRTLRDYLRDDVSEIVLDNHETYQHVLQHIKQFRPDFLSRLHFHNEPTPIFEKYGIEQQIDTLHGSHVPLMGGGAIVIDETEALTAVDINSARATKAADIEATALNTNLEAADEIARQLRLRDLGGLIVIDFIDMGETPNKIRVQERLAQAFKNDRARIQLGEISKFGLLEMSRQRIRPSIKDNAELKCPRCHGQGSIRSPQSISLSMLRLIRENAKKPGTSEVSLSVPIAIASYLINEKRADLHQIEQDTQVRVVVIPNPHIETPAFEIKRKSSQDEPIPSYQMLGMPSEKQHSSSTLVTHKQEEPALKNFQTKAAPQQKNKKAGFLSKLLGSFFPSNDSQPLSDAPAIKKPPAERKFPASRLETKTVKEEKVSATSANTQNSTTRNARRPAEDSKRPASKNNKNQSPTPVNQSIEKSPEKTANSKPTVSTAKPAVATKEPLAKSQPNKVPPKVSQAAAQEFKPAKIPPVIAPVLDSKIPSSSRMLVEEVLEKTTFSLAEAQARLTQQNQLPSIKVTQNSVSDILPQTKLMPLEETVINERAAK